MSNERNFKTLLCLYSLIHKENDLDVLVVSVIRNESIFKISSISYSNSEVDINYLLEVMKKKPIEVGRGVTLIPALFQFRDDGTQFPVPFLIGEKEMEDCINMKKIDPSGMFIEQMKEVINSVPSGINSLALKQVLTFRQSERVDFENLIQSLD
jgi:hypothetical protein